MRLGSKSEDGAHARGERAIAGFESSGGDAQREVGTDVEHRKLRIDVGIDDRKQIDSDKALRFLKIVLKRSRLLLRSYPGGNMLRKLLVVGSSSMMSR